MHTVISFDGDSIEPDQLGGLLADYCALEQARMYRRLFVHRFALLALILGTIGFGFRWLPPLASWFSVAVCAVAPVWAWVAELRCDRKLSKRLNEVPGATQVVLPTRAQESHKKFISAHLRAAPRRKPPPIIRKEPNSLDQRSGGTTRKS